MRTSIAVAAFLLAAIRSSFGQTLKQVAAFDLPGPAGKRFDYLTMDYEDHYLLSAHLAAGVLYVIDVRTNRSRQFRACLEWRASSTFPG
jgi:hypothetical protein